ncbi:hypothetical protein P7C73_g6830, partial [Tremellales sp. Uapishka_1]
MNFSPYPLGTDQPPPDVPSTDPPSESSRVKGKSKRPWFSRDPSTYGNTYQSGAGTTDPSSSSQAFTNDPESAAFLQGANGSNGYGDERANAWESRFGWRVDVMAAASYLGGPVTALLFLILETQNDFVRFHAYQSALLTTPLIVLLLFTNLLIPFPTFLRIIFLLASIGVTLYTAFKAWKDAQEGLGRFWLPVIGQVADKWVGEE